MKKKRANGEGSFRKLNNGKWSGQIMVGYNAEGKRIIKTFTAATRSEAQQMIRNYLDELEAEKTKKQVMSFSEWADTWYADYQTEVEESTYWNYSYTLNTLKKHFGDRPISEIRQLDINRFLDELVGKGRSKSTIRKCKSMLIQIFDSAEDNELISKNPASRAKKVKTDKDRVRKQDAFTPEEVNLLKLQLPDDLLGNSIMSLIGSGMRVQELLALTKDDIASDGSVISVNKAVKMAYRQPMVGSTKSECSNRTIPVSKEFQPYVRFIREHGGTQYIWTSNRENGLFTIEEFRNRYNRAIKKIPGVTYHSPHCCRHTYVTMLQARSIPMDIIRVLAGHRDVETTIDYSHISIDTLKAAIASLDASAENNEGGSTDETV